MNFISFDICHFLETQASLRPTTLTTLQDHLLQMDPKDLEHQIFHFSNSFQRPDFGYILRMIQYSCSHNMLYAPFYFRSVCEYLHLPEPSNGIAIERDGTLNLHHLTRFYESEEDMNLLAKRLFLHHPQWKTLTSYFGETVITSCHETYYFFRQEYDSERQWLEQDNQHWGFQLPTLDNAVPFTKGELLDYPLAHFVQDFTWASDAKWQDVEQTLRTLSPPSQEQLWLKLHTMWTTTPLNEALIRLITYTSQHFQVAVLLKHRDVLHRLPLAVFSDLSSFIQTLETIAAIDETQSLGSNMYTHTESTLYLA